MNRKNTPVGTPRIKPIMKTINKVKITVSDPSTITDARLSNKPIHTDNIHVFIYVIL